MSSRFRHPFEHVSGQITLSKVWQRGKKLKRQREEVRTEEDGEREERDDMRSKKEGELRREEKDVRLESEGERE